MKTGNNKRHQARKYTATKPVLRQ